MSIALIAQDPPECAADSGSACAVLWNWFGQAWLAESGEWLFVKPFRILVIIAVCLLARRLINKAISRMTRATAQGASPSILRPFKEKAPNLLDPTGVLGERRRQRSQALGSVLRSLVTGVVMTIMAMLVLAEFDVNLGPLLASAGIAGLAIGFGAQALVKDVISGIFMLLEDQYGVGDIVDLGEATGTVEAVGLRVTTLRDAKGVVWYVRNGEIIRVGNSSQGWAMVIVDVPIGVSASVDEASRVIEDTLEDVQRDERWADALLSAPELLGVESISADGTMLRIAAKVDSDAQWTLARELRRRVTEALRASGIASSLSDGQIFVRRSAPPPAP